MVSDDIQMVIHWVGIFAGISVSKLQKGNMKFHGLVQYSDQRLNGPIRFGLG